MARMGRPEEKELKVQFTAHVKYENAVLVRKYQQEQNKSRAEVLDLALENFFKVKKKITSEETCASTCS